MIEQIKCLVFINWLSVPFKVEIEDSRSFKSWNGRF